MRRMRLWVMAFGSVAIAFMIWSLWLIRSVGERQAEVAQRVALASRIRDVEPCLRELEQVLSETAVAGDGVDEERWTSVAQAYAESVGVLPLEGEIATLISRTDRCARRILDLGREARRTPGTPEVRLARLSEARSHLNRGLAAVQEAVHVLLQASSAISADLDRERRQLDYVAFVACILAALATALMEVNRRDNLRLAAADEDLTATNAKLTAEITQRSRSEAELAKRSEDLLRSNAELERFAYVASHDLQEPLRAVAAHVQILKEDYEGKLDADADESIRHAVEGATHMRLLINDLLAYSRIGRRNEPMYPTSADAALSTALRQLEVSISESRGEVVREPLPQVVGDPTQLVQLFQNLIGNAIKFHGERTPRVQVSAERDGASWLFRVQDNGIGIDPSDAERIFTPFERLHGRHQYPGSGVGLAICKKIVERHGGRIWVESESGAGATFRFTLPAAPVEGDEASEDALRSGLDAPGAPIPSSATGRAREDRLGDQRLAPSTDAESRRTGS